MKIIQGDCVQVMGAMPAGSVNLIVADPPYNIGIDYGCGPKADRRSDAGYIAFTREWIEQAARLLADDGSIWVICGQEYAGDHQIALRDCGLYWRNTVTWHETFGVNCRRKFSRTSRPMFYFTKHKSRFTFNVEALTTQSTRQRIGDKRANPAGKVFDDVWTISRVCGTFRERVKGVPTQLPEALARRVILGLSKPGDTVLDPFAGSGTTVAVATGLKRNAVGIEISQAYAEIARRRVAS